LEGLHNGGKEAEVGGVAGEGAEVVVEVGLQEDESVRRERQRGSAENLSDGCYNPASIPALCRCPKVTTANRNSSH
jgi:hypothetical protein